MSYIPGTNTLRGPNDNVEMWTKQFPELLPKNFLGLSRIWDKNFPVVTFNTLPARRVEFNFTWRVKINPGTMAPFVQEGADTKMSSAEVRVEKFICKEARIGDKITQREINFGLPNVVADRTRELVESINTTREWLNVQALTGVNVNQPEALLRLNLATAGDPKQTGTGFKAWNEDGGNIIADILAMKTRITKACGMVPDTLYMGLNEFEALQQDPEILDQLRYVNSDLLTNGQITLIKGLKVHLISRFWKERKKTGEELKHFVLEDKVIMTAGQVGFTGIAEPMEGSAPVFERWPEQKSRSLVMHAYSSFTPVITDYAQIGVIQGTDAYIP